MLLDMIMGSLGVLGTVMSVVRGLDPVVERLSPQEFRVAIRRIERHQATLSREVSSQSRASPEDIRLLSAYNSLLEVLRRERIFSSRLEFRPTQNGTWQLLRKRARHVNATILRDPEGEYDDTLEEVPDSSEPKRKEPLPDESWMPEFAEACRCTSRLQIREAITFEAVGDLVDRKKSSAPIRWLDLCCGSGNILAQIDIVLPPASIST